MRAAITWLGAVCAVACAPAYSGTARSFDPDRLTAEDGWLRARPTPLVRQEAAEDCGPAALAMLSAAWGSPLSLAEAVALAPPQPGRGVRAGALRNAARARGLHAFLVVGGVGDLRHELAEGRPMIVGLIEPHGDVALAHYEVVVGYHVDRGQVVTLDPAVGWRVRPLAGFGDEWQRAGNVLLVVVGAGQLDRRLAPALLHADLWPRHP